MAGRSFRFARSPLAPKMTIVVGWTGSRSRPSTSGLSCWPCSSCCRSSSTVAMASAPRLLGGLHRVPAELVAQRGAYLRRVRLVLAGHEAHHQRKRDDRRRHAAVDRLEHRPAALAGVVHVAADVVEVVALLLERGLRQLEQPG